MSKPVKFLAKVKEKKGLVGNFLQLVLETEQEFLYKAGQYISLKVSEGGERRNYSLASYPGEKNLKLVVDVKPMGLGSEFLLGLREGQEVELLGPMGEFLVKNEKATKGLLFVGTGSGIVPLRSMVNDLLRNKKGTRPVRLSWGMRSEEQLFWVEEFMGLQEEYKNFKFDLVLSEPSEKWDYCKGHVQDCLVDHKVDLTGWEAYLCGNKQMIEEVKMVLLKQGVVENAVDYEKFY